MAADLHIHVFEGIDEDDLRVFKRNSLGSKYFIWSKTQITNYRATHPMPQSQIDLEKRAGISREYDDWDIACTRISETPNVWVGEVSWLKAGITGDTNRYVPDPIQAVAALVGEDLPVIDAEFLDKMAKALQLENQTNYSLTHWNEVMAFLELHKGKRVFQVSW